MATISVSNASQLTSALASTHAGDVISLASGNYGDVSISGKSFASDVTITSADPLHAAVIRSLDIEASSGIHLNNINVNFTPTTSTLSFSSAVMINGSHGITVTGGVMVGGDALNGVAQTATAQDATGNVLGLPTARGITIQNSSGVNVSGTDISHFDRGVILVDATATTLDGNNIHDLRRTAIAGTGNNLTIENNNLHDSHPWRYGDTADQGDHADFIALWTDANQTTASDNIVIKNNIMAQGAGAPILGMWLQGETAGFTNVTIQGNAIEGGDHQGIQLFDVHGGTVTGNTLVQTSAVTAAPAIILQPGTSNIAVSGNLTSAVTDTGMGATGNTAHDNTLIQDANSAATGYYTASLVSQVSGLTNTTDIYNAVAHGVTFVADTTPVGPAVTALPLLATTGAAGHAVIGNYLAENLTGTAGNDTINGNGGADTLTGGAGNDTYYTNALAKVVEQPGGGIDTVIAKGDYTLGPNVENLVISNDAPNTWAGTGNELNNVIVGNSMSNKISGGDGDDTLDGGMGNDTLMGGNGNDVLLGGGGTDTLTGGNGADTFVIAQGFGADKVTDFSQAQGDKVLAVGDYTTAQVGADTVVTLATGDHITLAGVNMASLKPGWITEVDSLFGSATTAPPPIANEGGGAVVAATPTAAPALAAPAIAAPAAAVAAAPAAVAAVVHGVSLVGGTNAETFTGTASDDTINGGGGYDHLAGGAGNDTYIVPNYFATIVEAPGGGTDIVIAKGDYTLGPNLENLVISNDSPSAWAGTGNELNNVITGNSLNNKLNGMAGGDTLDGGAGNDTLTGGAGADLFKFEHGGGADVVTDFSYAQGDRVEVTDSHYTVSQVGANTVLNLGGGDQMVLQNVNLSTLHSDWIIVG